MARPVVVTAWLASAYVGPPVHLDGLLCAVWARRHPRHAGARRSDRRHAPAAPHLPLVRVSSMMAGCWAATAGEEFGASGPAEVWQTRRRTPEDWDHLSRPVHVAAGPAKDSLIRREARVAEGVRWLAYGSVTEIRKSLRLLWGKEANASGALGSARRSGAGEILRWSVTRGDHDISACFVADGRAVRHLPPAWIAGSGRWTIGAHEPPYWLPAGQSRVSPVGCPVTLRPAVVEALNAR